jgi:hypothetical protein
LDAQKPLSHRAASNLSNLSNLFCLPRARQIFCAEAPLSSLDVSRRQQFRRLTKKVGQVGQVGQVGHSHKNIRDNNKLTTSKLSSAKMERLDRSDTVLTLVALR